MRKKAVLIGIIFFLLISIAIITILVRQNQDNRQRASEGTPTITGTEAITPTSAGPMLDQEEWEFMRIINEHRATLGLAPLKVSVKLTKAAKWMSDDMAAHNKLDHVDSMGRNIDTRIPDFGYPKQLTGENIAYVFSTGKSAFDAWLASTQGHKEQMERASDLFVGVGRTKAANGQNWFWTADFGPTADEEITPTPTPTITDTPVPTAITTSTIAPTSDATPPTTQPTVTTVPTNTPTNTPTPTPTRTPTPTPTRTPTPTNTPTPSPTLTLTPTSTPTPSPTPVPQATATTAPPTSTPTPTATPVIVQATATSTPTPTIAKPGGIASTIGVLGGILIVIIGGIFLLAL